MKISYNWLKDFIQTDLTPERMSEILTDTGLEVEGLEKIESVKGGLKGLVIGHVATMSKHPDADKLNLTKVDVGGEALLDIVCGAPNVAAGQKVVVATVGTTINPTNGEPFKIKKAKIRGQVSMGMICAEDEIGLGESHAGIMVLSEEANVGMLASEFFKIENDYLIEIGLTPNRADAMSHWGVARDVLAWLKTHQSEKAPERLNLPNVDAFKADDKTLTIEVEVLNHKACPRYAGVSLTSIKVAPSPDWLQNKLRSIGAKPINNVVDITNYVLHDLGQPLHAFDADNIEGKKVIVQTLQDTTAFTTLDEVERKLDRDDLMICDAKKGMCIAGVFGGLHSGVTEKTTRIFLESAYFDTVSVRKTAKRHGLNTDASFRFERGIDPNITLFALKRAALLMKEICGAKISSDIIDIYPEPLQDFEVNFSYENCKRLTGKDMGKETIKTILTALDIEILEESAGNLKLKVPAYRVDVQREVDVIEEVMRIYGFNNIELPKKLTSSLSYSTKPNPQHIQNNISALLAANGFAEIMSNSLTNSNYIYENENVEGLKGHKNVKILNPLSVELDVMRQTLLFGGLEAISRNINRQQANLRLFEFGKTYHLGEKEYIENRQLALFITGDDSPENWNNNKKPSNFFNLKQHVDRVLSSFGIEPNYDEYELEHFQVAAQVNSRKQKFAQLGLLSEKVCNYFGISQPVWYAKLNWDAIMQYAASLDVKYTPLSKYPSVRRDLSLLVNDTTNFKQLRDLAQQRGGSLLKNVNLFDVYKGKNLETGKKSYALSFTIQDEEKTLTDKRIDGLMNNIQKAFEKELGASLR